MADTKLSVSFKSGAHVPPLGSPKPSADEKKLEKARADAERIKAVVAAVGELCHGWQASGFYDRQEPAGALALHDALRDYEEKT